MSARGLAVRNGAGAGKETEMVAIRKSEERGFADHGWLQSRHSFSFAGYHDPRHMGFRSLRVINEDRVGPGAGFPPHPHQDMEILSYVVDGALEHRDSMGNGSVIRPGDVQRMSAGTGVTHSEYNPSKTDGVHFLQIWVLPDAAGHPPGYEQRRFDLAEGAGRLQLVASRDGRDGSVSVHQDVNLYRGLLDEGAALNFSADPARHYWLQVIDGELSVGDQWLAAGDAAAQSGGSDLRLVAKTKAHVLLFDLA